MRRPDTRTRTAPGRVGAPRPRTTASAPRGSGRRAVATVVAIVIALAAGYGPAHAGLNVWTSGGPPDESILAVAVNPLTPGIVHAGTSGDGVFRSVDGGNTWTPTNTGLTNLIVAALAINPLDTAVVYAGTTGGGIFRSLDGGISWAAVNTGLTNFVVTAIAVNPQLPSTVYAGTTGDGVFRSLDGGNTWTAVNAGLTNTLVSALVINPVTPTVVYAATPGGGVFRSPNGGNSWVAVNNGLVNTVVTSLAIDPQTPNAIYAGTTGGGVFKTANAGGQWFPFNNGLANQLVTGLAVNPVQPATLYASTTGGGVFQSTNAAGSWSPFNVGLGNPIVNALAITPSGACVHAATRGTGVFDFAFDPTACAPIAVAASVLPSSRSVQVGVTATAFATIINPANVTAISCGIGLLSVLPATLSFQTTDPSTNLVTGSPNTVVNIGPGQLQTYVIGLTPTAAFASTEVRLNFTCQNTASAPLIIGVNTLLLAASNSPVPDIVALAAADAGVVNIPGSTATGVFAVATINMGSGDSITATADTGGVPVPVTPTLCETNPVTSQCLGGSGPSVTRTINPGDTPTYGISVTGHATVFFNPALNRIFVRFKDGLGVIRGSTSVAVRTQ